MQIIYLMIQELVCLPQLIFFLKQAVREQKIPFEIKREYPNYDTEMAIAEQSDEGSKVYDSVDELFEDLDK